MQTPIWEEIFSRNHPLSFFSWLSYQVFIMGPDCFSFLDGNDHASGDFGSTITLTKISFVKKLFPTLDRYPFIHFPCIFCQTYLKSFLYKDFSVCCYKVVVLQSHREFNVTLEPCINIQYFWKAKTPYATVYGNKS
jgi:hypothetical protein